KTACQSGLVGLATRKARRRELALAVTKALRGRSRRIITVRGKMGDAGCGGTTDEDCWQPGILGADLAVLTLHARSLHNCCGAIWVTESDRADTTWFAIGSVSHGPLASEYACQCHPESGRHGPARDVHTPRNYPIFTQTTTNSYVSSCG